MSSAAPVSDPAKVAEPSRRPWRPLIGRGLWIVTLLIVGFTAWRETPREISRWYLAAAQEHHADAAYAQLQGKSSLADQEKKWRDAALNQALRWDPQNVDAVLSRALWSDDKSAAIADFQRVLDLADDDIGILELRSHFYAQSGQFEAALKDQLTIRERMIAEKYSARRVLEQLNNVAYFRALNKSDLRQALLEINQVLAAMPKPDEPKLSPGKAHSLMTYLDTRGYIRLLLNQPKEAINDLDQAIALLQSLPPPRTPDPRGHRELRDYYLQSSAPRHDSNGIIYYHRALVLEKLGHKKDAARDRRLARQLLGKEPDESVF